MKAKTIIGHKGYMRTKKKQPMSSLNDLLHEQIKDIPTHFLANLLKTKIEKLGHKISDDIAKQFAQNIFENSDKNFQWDDGNIEDKNISIELTPDEVAKLSDDVQNFIDNDMQKIIANTSRESALIILKTLKKDWPNQKKFDRKQATKFKKRLECDWGDAFDILRMMLVISRELGQEFIDWATKIEDCDNPLQLECLIKLHARGCQVAGEIICLMENGFADGAIARWRTLHEITIVATLLADGDEKLATRYLDHECIEAKRAMDRFKENYKSLGYEKPSSAEIEKIEDEYNECLQEYGNNFGSQYGWSANHLGLKKPLFWDIEKKVGQIDSRSHYQFASYNVHASPKGLSYRLGLLDQESDAMLAGMSNVGFYEPAHNFAHSLLQLSATILNDRWDFDTLIEFNILIELRKSVSEKFDQAQRAIEVRHSQTL